MTDRDDLPDHLARLWRVAAASRLGRPATLDIERVVRAAVDLADQEGLAAVALARVATTLGVTKMSLYRYVGSKGELLDLMADLVAGPPPDLGAVPASDWRGGIRQWAVAYRSIFDAHPWLTELRPTAPPAGPNSVGWMETMLDALRGTGLRWKAKMGILNVVSGYVRQTGILASQLNQANAQTGMSQAEAERAYGEALTRLIEPEKYPQMAGLLRSGVFAETESLTAEEAVDEEFDFGLDILIDGIENVIGSAGAGPRTQR